METQSKEQVAGEDTSEKVSLTLNSGAGAAKIFIQSLALEGRIQANGESPLATPSM